MNTNSGAGSLWHYDADERKWTCEGWSVEQNAFGGGYSVFHYDEFIGFAEDLPEAEQVIANHTRLS